METAGACFERCPGQAPAEVLMLGQLEASAKIIVAQSAPGAFFIAQGQGADELGELLACQLPQAKNDRIPQPTTGVAY